MDFGDAVGMGGAANPGVTVIVGITQPCVAERLVPVECVRVVVLQHSTRLFENHLLPHGFAGAHGYHVPSFDLATKDVNGRRRVILSAAVIADPVATVQLIAAIALGGLRQAPLSPDGQLGFAEVDIQIRNDPAPCVLHLAHRFGKAGTRGQIVRICEVVRDMVLPEIPVEGDGKAKPLPGGDNSVGKGEQRLLGIRPFVALEPNWSFR